MKHPAKKTKPVVSSAGIRLPDSARLGKRGKNQRSGSEVAQRVEPQRLVHELQVHQVELRMQNEELQKTRDDLEAALEEYSDLYDFAPLGYVTLDREGVIQRANLTGASLLGITRPAMAKQRFSSFVSPEDVLVFSDFLARVFESRGREECDMTLLVKSQSPINVRLRANTFGTGKACRLAFTDVTDHKRAEDKVRFSEIRYRRLFEAAHDGVLLIDPATRKITDANPYMAALLGFSHEQLVGKEMCEIGLLKDEAASHEVFRKLQRNQEVRYENLPSQGHAGPLLEVEVVANLYEESGHPVVQCNIRDITARKQAEETLRRNEALFSALVEQAPVGVYVVDASLRLQKVNPKALPAFSKIHPLIGRDFSEILHLIFSRRVAGQLLERFRTTLRSGVPYQSPDFAERRRDTGVKESYEWQIQRVSLPDGEYGVVCFFNNVTERKRAEGAQRRLELLAASNLRLEQEIRRRKTVQQALRKSQQHQLRLLKESHHMQAQLRDLSHETLQAQEEERKRISRELHDVIAQTLTGINLRLASLVVTSGAGTQEFHKKISSTQRLVEKSVAVVHRFARELRPPALDDLGLIPALQSFLKGFEEDTGLSVALEARANIEQSDISIRTVLYRVAQEALTNVNRHAKATQAKVNIRIISRTVCMEITDNGKGFQTKGKVEGKRGGRLGLLGMRERVEMVGGTFSLESLPGMGITVRVEVPLGHGAKKRSPK